jgi:adenosylhomocysteine nucleosidase
MVPLQWLRIEGMSRVAIIAALAGELTPFVGGWTHESRDGVDLWSWQSEGAEWVAACAGIGAQAARRAFAEIERNGAVDLVVSAGWAGALEERFAAGRAYRVSGVIDAGTLERFPAATPSGECWLVTSDMVANQADKRRLAANHGGGLVDMEAAAVARLAASRGVPFYCIKGVSDGLADRLPDLNGFISPSGRFQRGRLIRYSLLRPWYWPALARIGTNCRKAAEGIGFSLHEILGRADKAPKRAGGTGNAVTGS